MAPGIRRTFGNGATRVLACGACVLAASVFVAGGIAVLTTQGWWRPVIVAAAAFSAITFILSGRILQALANKGFFAILINLADPGRIAGIAVALIGWRRIVLPWPPPRAPILSLAGSPLHIPLLALEPDLRARWKADFDEV